MKTKNHRRKSVLIVVVSRHPWFIYTSLTKTVVFQQYLLFLYCKVLQLEKLLPAVLPRFYQGLFAKDKKGSEEAKQSWLDAVKKATTVSRLHLLLGILDSAVIWDLSAENAV